MVPVLLFKKLDGKSSDLRLNYTGAGVSGSALTTISKMKMIKIEIDRGSDGDGRQPSIIATVDDSSAPSF